MVSLHHFSTLNPESLQGSVPLMCLPSGGVQFWMGKKSMRLDFNEAVLRDIASCAKRILNGIFIRCRYKTHLQHCSSSHGKGPLSQGMLCFCVLKCLILSASLVVAGPRVCLVGCHVHGVLRSAVGGEILEVESNALCRCLPVLL